MSYNTGDRVEFTYTHHLNSKSKIQITKTGTIIRRINRRGTSVYDWDANPKYLVLLDGNKTPSTIYYSLLKPAP